MILPLPNTVNIPATSVGSNLLYNDASIDLSGEYGSSSISLNTSGRTSLSLDTQQRVAINTNDTSSAQLTVNSNDTNILKLLYKNQYPVSLSINPLNGESTIDTNDSTLNITGSLNLVNHNKVTTSGLMLDGVLITAKASDINTLDTTLGSAQSQKALIVDSDRNINNINILEAYTLIGTLQTSYQPNVTSINTLNIKNHNGSTTGLQLNNQLVTATATELDYTKITTLGVAQPSKALVVDSSLNISNLNTVTSQQYYGSIRTSNQPFITTIGTLSNLSISGNIGIGFSGYDLFFKTEIRSATGKCLRLIYDDNTTSNYTELSINSNGALSINSSNKNIYVNTTNSFHIQTHNGIDTGLWLNGVLVKSSATQLNYVNTTIGSVEANKAVITDSNKSVSGINSITASTFYGLISTNHQPNITSVNTLNIQTHNGSTTGLSLNGVLVTATADDINVLSTTKGSAVASKALVVDSNRNISNINNLSASNFIGLVQTEYQPNIHKVDYLNITLHNGSTNGLFLGDQLVTSTASQLNYVNTTAGTAAASKALILDNNRNIQNINILSANNISGTITTSSQPIISSVNVLNIQNHNGSTTGLSLNGTLVTTTALEINYLKIQPGSTLPNKALVLNSAKSIFGINELSASLITGQLVTNDQPNIKTVNTLDILNHDGATTGLSLNGVLVTVNATELNYLDTLPGSAAANKAIILSNTKSIGGIGSIFANSIEAVVTTQYQPNITKVDVLNIANHNGTSIGLKLADVLVTCTAEQINRNNTVLGIAEAEKTLSLDSNKNITGINLLTSTYLNGTLQTSNQPNISSVNSLNIQNHNGTTTGLSLNGVLVKATASELNYLKATVGSGLPLTALVLDNNRNISNINSLQASYISGTIDTPSQPNITSVNTLDIQNHNGSTGLKLNGSLVIASADQLNTTTSQPGIASPLKALITNSVNTLNGINGLSATKITTESLEVSGIIKNINTGGLLTRTYASTDFVGRVVDIQLLTLSSFSNITPAGLTNNFSMEIIGYIYPQYSETYTFFVQCQDRVRLWVNDKLILCSWTYVATARMSSAIFLNANTWYPIYAQYQVDSNSSLFLLEWASSSTIRSSIPASKMAWDNMDPNHSSNEYVQNSITLYNSSTASLNQTSFTVDNGGDLLIDSSGNDIRFGTNDNVNIQSHDGSTSGLYLGGQLVTPTAFELNYLKVSPGIATATHALVVDGTNSISGLTSLSSTALSCRDLTANNFAISNLTLNGPLSNFNTGGLVIKQITGGDLSGRVVDVSLTTTLALVDYDPKGLNGLYSLEITGYILPQFTENYTFYVTANDRARLWINNKLVLNIWDTFTGVEYTSSSISLTMNQWTKIHIQFQNISGASLLQVKWSSPSTSKNLINSSYMAWDNRDSNVYNNLTTLDSITIAPSSSNIGLQSGSITVNNSGSMTITTAGNIISISDQNSLNIAGHNGTNKGLMLNGTLLTASATELNYLSNSSFGVAGGGKVMILDNNRSINNINSLSATTLVGTLATGAQPNITSIGTVTSTFSISSDLLVGDLTNTNGRIRFGYSSGTSYIQSGIANTVNSSNDLMIGNMNADKTTSTRKFMIKSNGYIGIQTILPNRTLTINGSGSTYLLRLVYDNNTGTELSGFTDIGTDTNGTLLVSSNIKIGSDTNNATLLMNGSSLKLISTSGSIQIGNTSSSNVPLEIGSTTYSIPSGSYGYINSSGATGAKADTNTSTFSIKTTGRIISGGEIDIVSDRRSKTNIERLDINTCRSFIDKIDSVSFKYKESNECKSHYGFVAQDVYKAGFKDLVSLVPDDNINEEIDNDGFVNPNKQKFVLCYDEIIPILTTNIKDLYEENKKLKSTIMELYDELILIKSKLI